MIRHLADFVHFHGPPEKSRLERCGGSTFPEFRCVPMCGHGGGDIVTDKANCGECLAIHISRQSGLWKPSVVTSRYESLGMEFTFKTIVQPAYGKAPPW